MPVDLDFQTFIPGGDDKGNWIGSSPSLTAVTLVCIRPQTVQYPDPRTGKGMSSGFPSLYSLERAHFIVRWWGHGGFNLWGRLEKSIDIKREILGEV